MITVHQFAPALGLPNASPFCMKLEGFLRMTGLPYRIESVHDLASAPKGKAPFVDLDGERIGDSELVLRALERRHGIDLDRDLGPGKRAVAHAFRVMLEERTYFALLHERWIEERNWPLVRDGYLGDLPAPVQDAMALLEQRAERQRFRRRPVDAFATLDHRLLGGELAGQQSQFGRRQAQPPAAGGAGRCGGRCPRRAG
mgnify:CR=1 FL=1